MAQRLVLGVALALPKVVHPIGLQELLRLPLEQLLGLEVSSQVPLSRAADEGPT